MIGRKVCGEKRKVKLAAPCRKLRLLRSCVLKTSNENGLTVEAGKLFQYFRTYAESVQFLRRRWLGHWSILICCPFSAEDIVVIAANEVRRMLFYPKRSFVTLTPCTFLPLYKILTWPHLEYAFQASHHIPRRRGSGKGSKSHSDICEITSACPVWSSSPTASTILTYTPAIPWWSNTHGLLEFPMAHIFTHPTHKGRCDHAFEFHQQRCCTRRR